MFINNPTESSSFPALAPLIYWLQYFMYTATYVNGALGVVRPDDARTFIVSSLRCYNIYFNVVFC